MSTQPLAPGLQRERTALAWSRTSLGVVGNAVLVLARHQNAFPLGISLLLTSVAVALLVVCQLQARSRSRLTQEQEEEVAAPRTAVLAFGGTLAVLCCVTVVAIVLGP